MSGPHDLTALRAAAEANDPNAQYALAAALHAERRLDAAMAWTERAANAGHAQAQYTLAAYALSGAVPLGATAAKLAPLTTAADPIPQARRLMSVALAWGLMGQPDWRAAAASLVSAARSGDPGATREVAVLQAMAASADTVDNTMLALAAERGDPIAVNWCKRSSSLVSAPDWEAVEATIAAIAPERAENGEALCASPKISVFRRLFKPFECEYLTMRAATLVQPSQVVDEATGEARPHPDRSSTTVAFWPLHDDLVVHRLTLRMTAAARLPWRNGEMLNVMRYEQGQQYKPHFDFFNESAAGTAQTIAQGGQRIRTALVYLNSGYNGGETFFIPANLRFKGDSGDAIVFDNVDAAGAPDRSSLHAGLPVTDGVKWLASKWFRAACHW